MIVIKNLQKSYKGVIAVDVEELEIHAGEVIGLVGNNGAGKTTFFRLLLDLIRANKGEILSKGIPVTTTEEWKSYTAAYIDEGFLIDYLTPEEYFYFVGKLNQLSKADVDDFLQSYQVFFDEAVLGKGKYIRDFSKGNQFKIGIVAALLTNPELLILDEPFANLDPTTQLRLVDMIKEMAAHKQMCVVVSSHDINHVSEVSSRVLLMEKGKIIKDIAGGEAAFDEMVDYFKVK
ncbi:ABC transporter ATP-binding protein [Ferruginibacter sp.]|uniref:ABC transporter ATP-binding protein n=1 Tax=Ferruginibacter sp. TaxID=1940288 RepID=UPI001996C22E|nr:ABC transporter ATP-binding protein [Ferruginibacter sp.]MBC7626093.1 ABC transporter ATP-binding protein [Ferruginibacter sp.]